MTKHPDEASEDTTSTRVSYSTSQAAGQSRENPCLIVLSGTNVGEIHRLHEGETIIGRATIAQLRIQDEGVSRKHARVLVRPEATAFEDLGSANGSFVNGERTTGSVPLSDGDKIQLGTTTIIKFTFSDQLEENFQRQMYNVSVRDALTKAHNKRYFLDRLETEFAYARRHQAPLGLILFDVDFFKKVNDTHGHLVGDEVLAGIGSTVLETVRSHDLFARYGGEEFAVLTRGSSLAELKILAERLRVAIEARVFRAKEKVISVTISLGVAAYPELPAENPVDLVGLADSALYEAKKCGRNRTVVARRA